MTSLDLDLGNAQMFKVRMHCRLQSTFLSLFEGCFFGFVFCFVCKALSIAIV